MSADGTVLAASAGADALEAVGEVGATTRMFKRYDLPITLDSGYQSSGTEFAPSAPPFKEVPGAYFTLADGSKKELATSFPLYTLKNTTSAGGENTVLFTLSRCRAAGTPAGFCLLLGSSTYPFPVVVYVVLAFALAANIARHLPNFITIARTRGGGGGDEAAEAKRSAALLDLLALGTLFAWRLKDEAVHAGHALLDPSGRTEVPLLRRLSGTWRPENALDRRIKLQFWVLQGEGNWPAAWRALRVRDFLRAIIAAPFTGAAANLWYGWWFRRGCCVRMIAAPALLGCVFAHGVAVFSCAMIYGIVSLFIGIANFVAYSDKQARGVVGP